MSVTIEQDLKEYLALQFEKIDQRFEKIDQRLDRIEHDITDLKVGQARMEEKIESLDQRLEAKIDGLEQKLEAKMDGLDKRLEFQEFINRGVLIGFIVAILAGLAKLFGFIPNA